MENPKNSPLWSWPPLAAVRRIYPDLFIVELDYWALGAPWRKATRILTNIPTLVVFGRPCDGRYDY